jgi:hypothetical protein
VSLFRVIPNRITAQETIHRSSLSRRKDFLIRGSLGFCLSSLMVFGTVAFAARWMYRQFGQLGAYGVWTGLFILLGGTLLTSLIARPKQRVRFLILFGIAFLAYAAAWTTAYFVFGNGIGEWIGGLTGCAAFGAILALAFGATPALLRIIVEVALAHSAGYFLGSMLHDWIGGPAGMLLWGLCYGLGFGLGLGEALYLAQASHALTRQSPAVHP